MEPSDEQLNYSKIYSGKPKKVRFFAPIGKEQFDQEWLYFSLYSITGCTLNLLITYADDERKKQREGQMYLIELSAIPQHEIDAIQSYRRKTEKKNEVRTDIIEKNKNVNYLRAEERLSNGVLYREHAQMIFAKK